MKAIFRNFYTTLLHFKLASALNILGLGVAFAAFLIIIMQVDYEYSFDKFHSNADRIYRVAQAVCISLIACGVGIAIVEVVGGSSMRDIVVGGVDLSSAGVLVGYTVVVAVGVGLLSGLYPAFYTTKFPPVMVIKGSFAMSPSGKALRVGLISFQFVISIGLIIAAMFLLSLAIVLTIILVTVTVQSYRAATENPVKSIMSE